ncbi:Snf2 family helicase [Enterococcus sp. JM4C]|uniref:DEAD/DEAH box helicase n=1 Tax=Candidatus Enterococcus huntleyi TaxID=1857217 RepID=UPI001379973E|nr:DEAD/DEAH box helicase [Enterococcus sp. JM4C]KAF1296385.1 Snf2 family helicase [Enterococcus sp. JM4C]
MKWSIPEKVIERGRTYLNEGRVLSVTPDFDQKVWHAEVLGTELYLVDLDGTSKENDLCQCPYWQDHQYCKHTIAVELYLRKQTISRVMKDRQVMPETNRVSTSSMFTKGFARLQEPKKRTDMTPLFAEFTVESIETNQYHPEFSVLGIAVRIGYATGKKRSYVVKNIYEFLQAVEEEGEYTVNKQYAFSLVKRAFDLEQWLLLKELSAMAQTQQLLGTTGLSVKGKLDKRYLLLPVQRGKELLERMAEVNELKLVIGDDTYKQIQFTTDDLPLELVVEKTEDAFELQVTQTFEHFFSYYHWGMIAGKFYVLTSEQQAIYTTLEQLLKRLKEPAVAYQRHELSQLFREVLPVLKKIGRIEVQESVTAEVSDTPVQAVMYFRKVKGMIQVRVDFIYGDVVYSTDKKHQVLPEGRKEVLRETVREEQILSLLPLYSYKKNATGFEKNLPAGERLYAFFTTELMVYRRHAEVKVGKKLRELYLDAQHYQPQIEVKDDGSWLDVRFDVTGIEEQEIDAVLQSLLNNDRFYTLENGQVLSFDSEEFQQTSSMLSQLREKIYSDNGRIQVPRNQGLVIQDKLKGSRTHFSASFDKMVTDLIHPEEFSATLPKGLNATLREYQVTGFKWLKMLSHYQFGGILADEMGLGKTIQMITYLLSEKEENGAISALIVAPASLIYNWQAEIKKFAPSLTSVVVGGNRNEREALLQTPVDIRITSYASLRQDEDLYQKEQVGYLVLDEAQMVKNSATKTAQALRKLQAPQRFALSGTPIENNLEELWSLFQTIMPGFFPGKSKFRELTVADISQMIKPFILRRDKTTVLKDLPEKIESNLYSVLTEEQKKVYLAYLRQMREQVNSMDAATFKKNRISILAGLTRLRQICCDPRLFIDDYVGGSGKLAQVKEMVIAAKENNRRVLLFSQFTSMLSIIEEELAELGITSFYLRGSTKPQDRITMVDAFNEGEKDIFLISLKAGGTGLNLTGADTVILYDLWWNPAVEQQAAGRAHRIGQKNVVEVWRMIAEGTIEERMDSLQQEKRELFQKVIQGNDEQLSKLTEEDIRLILSIGDS